MDYPSRLASSHKGRLVGNLLCSLSDQAGFGVIGYGEQPISPEGMGIYLLAEDGLSTLARQSRTWQPDRITATYTAGHLELSEIKSVYQDTLVDMVTFRNTGTDGLQARVVVVSNLRGRKASALCTNVRGVEGSLAVLSDLSLSHNLWVALGTNRRPDVLRWAPFRQALVQRLRQLDDSPVQCFKQDMLLCAMVFDLFLQPGESTSWTLALNAGNTAQQTLDALRRPLLDGRACVQEVTAAWDDFFQRQVPAFACNWQELADLYYYAWYVQRVNRVEIGSRRLPWPFGIPARFKYTHLWLWDACFQAIILRWLRDPSYYQGALRSVANQQYPHGMLPHETYLRDGTAESNWPDGDGQSSSVTQPPVFGLALWEIYCATGDRQLLADLWPALLRYDHWFEEFRDPDGDHLFDFVHRWETGWDYSPRWDDGFDVEPVDVNALMVIQRQVLARCADMFGRPDLADEYRLRARQVSDAIDRLMWDGTTGMFYDLRPGNRLHRVRSPAAFCTMLAGIPSPQQAEALVRRLTNPTEFWTDFPVPTVARDDPAFDSQDHWRGSTWIHLNWWIIKGLLRYGYRQEATELMRRTFGMMLSQGKPTCNECYNSLTGAEARTPDYSWSGLVADLVITCVGGLIPRADGHLECNPLDIGLDSFLLDDVPYQGHRIRLAFERKRGYDVFVDGQPRAQRPDLGPVGPLPMT